MVKVASFTVFVLTIAAVKAQTSIVIANYPPINAVPPVNSPQVLAWLKEIDLTGAPAIPKTTAPKGSPPVCAVPAVPNSCVWACDACAADDITSCAIPNTWGLTFDDGPSTATPTLLDYLKTNKLSASFFLIGSNVIQHPEMVKREIAEGHHLASHTWSHTALTSLSNEEIVAEMKWTEKAVLDATGLKLKYMRPPYGDINNRVRFVLKKMGYIPVDWTGDDYDTNDWRIGSANFTEDQAVKTFSGSLDKYVAGTKAAGFYCLEHDVSNTTVSAALKLIPQGLSRKINFANVATCESDATPYQAGGTASIPTNPALPKPSGNTTATSAGGSTATSGPKVVANAAINQVASISVVSAIAVAAAAILA
ncbi:chitin deacetylase [Entomortierella lignicola]|nr:chitin deacetylase [Entomortierella lignicola]